LPEDEKTSKHRGGGMYNAILEFKGRIKREKNKYKQKERKNMYEKREKI
jgi:hypothetical protein